MLVIIISLGQAALLAIQQSKQRLWASRQRYVANLLWLWGSIKGVCCYKYAIVIAIVFLVVMAIVIRLDMHFWN